MPIVQCETCGNPLYEVNYPDESSGEDFIDIMAEADETRAQRDFFIKHRFYCHLDQNGYRLIKRNYNPFLWNTLLNHNILCYEVSDELPRFPFPFRHDTRSKSRVKERRKVIKTWRYYKLKNRRRKVFKVHVPRAFYVFDVDLDRIA